MCDNETAHFLQVCSIFLVAREGIANNSIWSSQINKLTKFQEEAMPGGHVWQHVTQSQGPRMCDIQPNCVFAMEYIPQLLLSSRKITNSMARYIRKFPSTQKKKNCVIMVIRSDLYFGVSRNPTTLYRTRFCICLTCGFLPTVLVGKMRVLWATFRRNFVQILFDHNLANTCPFGITKGSFWLREGYKMICSKIHQTHGLPMDNPMHEDNGDNCYSIDRCLIEYPPEQARFYDLVWNWGYKCRPSRDR